MNNIYLSLRLGFNIIENDPFIYVNVVGFFFLFKFEFRLFCENVYSLIGIYIILMIQFIKS